MYSAASTIWVLLGAALVFFMQAGFAMVETGFTRSKNAGNIIMKNLMDFSIGTPLFWLTGFGLMFGGSSAFIGGLDLFSMGQYTDALPAGVPKYAFFIFQTVFCATAATIVSGAMAERTKFISYCIYSALISAIVYPISGHWIWGGGWLAQLGFHDFAGSTAVHMVGGVAAFVGATILGPRIGKFSKDGKPKAIPGHSLTLGALGVFILWFCWFGFNGCSTVSADGDEALIAMGTIFTTTNLAAAIATLSTMIITWLRYGKPDVSMTLNGSLAGLVAITAGCDVVDPFGAFCIGLVASFVVVFGIEFVEKVLKVDDPVGAVGVHGMCGAIGTVLTGLFSTTEGLFYGHGVRFLGIQILGVVCVIVWVAVMMTIIFQVINHTIGLRVSATEEISGLDLPEHGLVSAYADFYTTGSRMISSNEVAVTVDSDQVVSPEVAIPVTRVEDVSSAGGATKMTQIRIITKENHFEVLKEAMNRIGITGMTVNHVLGCGMQKGSTELYRGTPLEINLLPKVQVDIVVCKVPVETVIKEAKRVLYTGHIGDGKIFVYNVENVIKVRTGEEGYDALQDK